MVADTDKRNGQTRFDSAWPINVDFPLPLGPETMINGARTDSFLESGIRVNAVGERFLLGAGALIRTF